MGGDAEQIHRQIDTHTEGARSHNKNIDCIDMILISFILLYECFENTSKTALIRVRVGYQYD